ncbi:hypothetical protein SDC9_165658 [bioreactor metagenome]|uniref:Uncharacterized protein n=1 Tax=bioreactor metagenome TaxID=1076179 RepID=A0A645FUV9_9ZZZZ
MNLHGDTAPVIHNGDGIILMQGHVDLVGIAIGRFIDGVIDDLPKEMMQPALSGRTDVHARAHADGIQPLHNFNFIYCIIRCHTDSHQTYRMDCGKHQSPAKRKKPRQKGDVSALNCGFCRL